MQISKNKVVTIDYTLTDDDGKVIDSSKDREPLAYVQGIGNIIPGLEAALEGRSPGDILKVAIAPEQAYGVRDEALMRSMERALFKDVADLEVGMQFMAQMENSRQMFTVVSIEDALVLVDGNHPLAGMNLNFDVTVREVREATAEELSHGHAHGAHGHH